MISLGRDKIAFEISDGKTNVDVASLNSQAFNFSFESAVGGYSPYLIVEISLDDYLLGKILDEDTKFTFIMEFGPEYGFYSTLNIIDYDLDGDKITLTLSPCKKYITDNLVQQISENSVSAVKKVIGNYFDSKNITFAAKNTQDKMSWTSLGKSPQSFISEILSHSQNTILHAIDMDGSFKLRDLTSYKSQKEMMTAGFDTNCSIFITSPIIRGFRNSTNKPRISPFTSVALDGKLSRNGINGNYDGIEKNKFVTKNQYSDYYMNYNKNVTALNDLANLNSSCIVEDYYGVALLDEIGLIPHFGNDPLKGGPQSSGISRCLVSGLCYSYDVTDEKKYIKKRMWFNSLEAYLGDK